MSHTPILGSAWGWRQLLPVGSGNGAALQHEEGRVGAARKVLRGPRKKQPPQVLKDPEGAEATGDKPKVSQGGRSRRPTGQSAWPPVRGGCPGGGQAGGSPARRAPGRRCEARGIRDAARAGTGVAADSRRAPGEGVPRASRAGTRFGQAGADRAGRYLQGGSRRPSRTAGSWFLDA
jgi:hypothetical protein